MRVAARAHQVAARLRIGLRHPGGGWPAPFRCAPAGWRRSVPWVIRRFQLIAFDGGAAAAGAHFDTGGVAVVWPDGPAWQLYTDVEVLRAETSSRYELVWLDAEASAGIDAGCDCDFVGRFGRPPHSVEIHHWWPDDGAPHIEGLDCGCQPRIYLQQPDLIVAIHVDADEPEAAAVAVAVAVAVADHAGPPGMTGGGRGRP